MRKQAPALKEELGRHDRVEREAAIAYTTKLRTELSYAFAKILCTVEIAFYMPDRNLLIGRDLIKDHMEQTFRIRELINALSYDVCLRICSYNLAVLLSRIMSNAIQKEPIGDDWSNLQKIKKVTFRILHKKEPNEEREMLSLLEVQNIMGISDKLGREIGREPLRERVCQYV